MTRLRTVAALYIDPRGPYPRMPGVDSWPAARDARAYEGPFPIVAHPPCAHWSPALRKLAKKRTKNCGPRAVDQVQAFGGVLEQPAGSKLFAFCGLPLPRLFVPRDWRGGFSLEVEQVAWGHCARKRTWLYFVGVDPASVCQSIRTGGRVTHWQSGHSEYRPESNRVPHGIRICSAEQRRRTPPQFAEWLIALARTVRRSRMKEGN
jgi:hypothetical protein